MPRRRCRRAGHIAAHNELILALDKGKLQAELILF